MRTISIAHLARVEGHGGVTVEIDGGAVRSVRFDVFEGPRLLEGLVCGRSFEDISPILSRICAICSHAHALTSLKATESAFGVQVSPQTAILRDLMLRGQSIQSHALHLFLLALPDYLGYSGASALAADKPQLVRLGLGLKKLGNAIQEAIGGRAIHPVNAVPGGFGSLPREGDLIALRRELIAATRASGAVLDVMAALPPPASCRCPVNYIALRPAGRYGYYAGTEIAVASGATQVTAPASAYRSLLDERAVPHSHARHSTFQGRPVMTGALARLTINRHILDDRAVSAAQHAGLPLPSDDPSDNNKAQAVELVADLFEALRIVEQLLDSGMESEPRVTVRPRAGAGVGVTEAPRGLLIHNYTYDDRGRITAAHVVTPTAINAAAIEGALYRTAAQSPATGEAALQARLEAIVRAYDPCISCSVHLLGIPYGH